MVKPILDILKAVPGISGIRLIGAVQCPELGVQYATLMVCPERLELSLTAQCGCTTTVDLLQQLIQPLGAQIAARQHQGGRHGTH